MKKFLLYVLTAFAAVSANAAVPTTGQQTWSKSVTDAIDASTYTARTPIAVDANGNVIAVGQYSKDLTLAGKSLEAIGSSAFIAKYDATGEIKWAVGLVGSATVNTVKLDDSGNIYVAGVYADEVVLGSTDSNTATIKGWENDGSAGKEQSASFIAKYDANGKLLANRSFVPESLPSLVETGMYYPYDGDVFFRINNLEVNDSKVYVSATFTGQTTIDGTKFEGSYNDPWYGVYFIDLTNSAIISFADDLTAGESVLKCGLKESLATDEGQYKVSTINFTVNDGTIYAVISGNGPLTVSAKDATQTITAEATDYNYIFAEVSSSSIDKVGTAKCPTTVSFNTSYVPSYMTVNNGKVYTVGYETFDKDDSSTSHEIFTLVASTDNFIAPEKTVVESVNGNVTYYGISSATTLNEGELFINAQGYYNVSGDDYSNGDLEGSARTFSFTNGKFTDSTISNTTYGVSARNNYVAISQVSNGSYEYSLYKTPDANVSTINADINSVVEYYNLQGIKLNAKNLPKGLIIQKQGTKAVKMVIK